MANEHLQPRASPITTGEIAPDFTLPDQNRKEWTLSEAARQSDVVLSFFPMAFTGVCGLEMKCLTAEMAQWQGKGVQAVGISCDSPAALKAWSVAEGIKHPLLADMHRRVCRAYGLYWPELNVSSRGTVVITGDQPGQLRVKWAQAREIKKAMDWNEVLAVIA
jgi:peroxiredoxin